MRIYNTLSRQVEEFVPHERGKIAIYVCGITPYDYCHLGHARTLVAFDIIRRWWEHSGYAVLHILNVTDIDDKIISRAKQEKVAPLVLSAKFDAASREDMLALGLLPPTHMPKISEFIPQTIALIEKIIANKHAYITESGVYFDISSFPEYGRLSGQDLQKIRAGARIEVDGKKKSPEDFALWKKEETPGAAYDSPWGRGRPGWHIECSAMSLHYTLGQPLDAHGGARDLIFPHHENEIAQSEASGTRPFSRHWIHTGFLTVNGEKMAKSLGNFITIRDAMKKFDSQTLRMFFALTHYRSPIDYSEKSIASAKNTLDNVRRSLSLASGEGAKDGDLAEDEKLSVFVDACLKKFENSMGEDFDTPVALAELFAAAKEIARAKAEGKCSGDGIGLEASKVIAAFAIFGIDAGVAGKWAASKITKEEVEKLVAERAKARAAKDWAESDEIRKKLHDLGILVEDSKDGKQIWRYA